MAGPLCRAAVAGLLAVFTAGLDEDDTVFLEEIGAPNVGKGAEAQSEILDLGKLIQQHVILAMERFHGPRNCPQGAADRSRPIGARCGRDADCTSGRCDSRGHCTCPEYWTQCGQLCYWSRADVVVQSDAQRTCRGLGGQLVVPRSSSELACLLDTLRENPPVDYSLLKGRLEIWLGLHDRDRDLEFQGEDGLGPTRYTNWAPNEPNQDRTSNKACVKGVLEVVGLVWYSAPCSHEHVIVCQHR